MNNTNLAPVLVTVYDRVNHLKSCIESLEKCAGSKETDVYIVSDGPAKIEDVDKVNAVREYIETIDGFKNVHKIFRVENYGVPHSVREAFEYVIKKHGKIILMEDDIVVAPNFLQYVNDGLNFYEKDRRIYSISGYCPPINISDDYPYDIFLCQRFNAWGYGTWLDRWDKLELSREMIEKTFKSKRNRKKIRQIGNDIIVNLLTWKKEYYPGDYKICFKMVNNNLYSVTPVISKTNNMGYDGTGVRCKDNNNFKNPILDAGLKNDIMVEDIQPDPKINNLIKSYHSYLKHEIKYFLYKNNLLRLIPKSIYSLVRNGKRK